MPSATRKHEQHSMAKIVTTSRALVRNTFFNLLMLMSNAIVAFLLVPFFVGQLGKPATACGC